MKDGNWHLRRALLPRITYSLLASRSYSWLTTVCTGNQYHHPRLLLFFLGELVLYIRLVIDQHIYRKFVSSRFPDRLINTYWVGGWGWVG